jgi:hypothetical protein
MTAIPFPACGVPGSLVVRALVDPHSPAPELKAVHYDFCLARAADKEWGGSVPIHPEQPLQRNSSMARRRVIFSHEPRPYRRGARKFRVRCASAMRPRRFAPRRG